MNLSMKNLSLVFTAGLFGGLVNWGGLWGLLFLIPLGRLSFPVKGLLISLLPSMVQLFWVFPFIARKGILGLQLGALTPLVVLIYTALWGIPAGLWLKWALPD